MIRYYLTWLDPSNSNHDIVYNGKQLNLLSKQAPPIGLDYMNWQRYAINHAIG